MATRGRKPIEAPAEIINTQAEQETGQALEVLRADEQARALAASRQETSVRALAAQLGYQLPADCADPDLIQRDIAANMRRSVEACLEVGRGLCVLKQACEHGQFMARLDVLGIEDRVARRFMQAAAKFSKRALTPDLTKAIGNQTKLFEMLVLDDEQIEELELTGQTGDLTLDDVATMSVKELRAALRAARTRLDDVREELAATEELSSEKTRKLEQLKRRIKTQAPDAVRGELLAEVSEYVNTALGMLNGAVRQAFTVVVDHDATAGSDSRQILAGHVAQLQQSILLLRDEHDLPDYVGDGTPEWMRATADDADLAGA
jgi:hypothetical protein